MHTIMPKKRRSGSRVFAEALIGLPYAFLGIHVYENGVDLLAMVLAIVLFLIVPGIIIALWNKL